MKTIRKLNIKDWSGYFFKEMVNILDVEPEYFIINNFKGCKNGPTLFHVYYCKENSVLHIVFNDIECIFRKGGVSVIQFFVKVKKKQKDARLLCKNY